MFALSSNTRFESAFTTIEDTVNFTAEDYIQGKGEKIAVPGCRIERLEAMQRVRRRPNRVIGGDIN